MGEHTFKYCSQIIVVHFHATVFFSKVHQACHNIANGIKPGSDSKRSKKTERDFMMSLSDDKQADVIDAFNTTSRYLDDILNINKILKLSISHF